MIFGRKSVSKRGAVCPVESNVSAPENRAALPNSALAAFIGENGTDPGLEAAMLARISGLLGSDEVTPSPLKIHYNSLKPQQFSAKAYTRGTDIYLAPGEEDSLSHELGHVRQQALGGIQPTRMAAGQPVNDDPLLEAQADNAGCLTGWLPTAVSGSVIQCDGNSDSDSDSDSDKKPYTKDHPPDGMVSYGANQGLTFHRPVEPVSSGHTIRNSKLKKIYTKGGQERGIHYPHSFRETPYRQVGRWLSSALADQSGISGEIQCYFDEASHELLIATNEDKDLDALRSISYLPSKPKHCPPKAHLKRRRERHMRKLHKVLRRLEKDELVYPPEGHFSEKQAQEQNEIYRDIYFNYPVRFIGQISAHAQNLHAEQRILEYLRGIPPKKDLLLDPSRLGGLRRPCLACASIIFKPEDAKRYAGPFWNSKPATDKWAERDSVLGDPNAGTHVTASRIDANRYSLHYDMDSESDLDPFDAQDLTESESSTEDDSSDGAGSSDMGVPVGKRKRLS